MAVLSALEAPGTLRAPGAISIGCKHPGGGSSQHSLKEAGPKGSSCGLHLWQTHLCTVPALAPQGCWVHVYFCKWPPTVCRMPEELMEDLRSRHPRGTVWSLRLCGTLGGFLEGARTVHPRAPAFRVGFSLPRVATCWVTAPVLHRQPSDHVAPL